MRLALNAFQLRLGKTPTESIADTSRPDVEFHTWSGSELQPLASDDAELLEAATDGDIVVALYRRPGGVPAWQQFMRNTFSIGAFGAPSDSLGAVVFCAVAPEEESPEVQWIAWTFGSGSRTLRRNATDPRFGLVAALNALVRTVDDDTDQQPRQGAHLQQLQYRTTEPYIQQTSHRASRDIPVDGFRIDRQSDLVSAAGGPTADPVLGDVLGGRSLRFRSEISSPRDFAALSTQLVQRAREIRYREEFAWVDNMRPVFDEVLAVRLREELLGLLTEDPVPPSVDVIIPDDLVAVDDERAVHYVAYPRERLSAASRTTLTIEMLAPLVTSRAVWPQGLDTSLRFLDASRKELGSVSVLECLCAELRLDDTRFMLYDGDFYEVEAAFVDEINRELDQLAESSIDLPCYAGGSEGVYNAHAAEVLADRLVLLDNQFLRLAGQSGVEPCDVIDTECRLVHVKRKGRSSVLSHLCTQATASCELLRGEPEAQST